MGLPDVRPAAAAGGDGVTYRWDDLPEWQQAYIRRLGLTGYYYGQDAPTAWCHIEARPPDDLPGKRAAYVPSWRPRWHGPGYVDFEARPAVPDHTPAASWIDPKVWAQYIEAPTRRQRVRRWARRRLWFMTRDGRQTRELRRLLEAIDRQAREADL
jgi:hypothetical protein